MKHTSLRDLSDRFKRYRRSSPPSRSHDITIPVIILTMTLGLIVVSLAWAGYRAAQEWRRSARMVVERRVEEVAALLSSSLARDMRSAQLEILLPFQAQQLILDPPYDFSNVVASAFARFPYPESFFIWKSDQNTAGTAVLFNRTDRPPTWERTSTTRDLFPVTIIRDSPVVYRFASLAREHTPREGQFAVFEAIITKSTYQVVERVFRHTDSKNKVFAVVGFTVSLDWVRTGYVSEFTRQIERISENTGASALSLAILDQRGELVWQTRPPVADGPFRERQFPLAFFDSSATPFAVLADMPLHQWTARVSPADDPLLQAADTGARNTLIFIVFAVAASVIALLLGMRSVRTHLQLIKMKADFVAMVSHELKTPLTGISLVGETLSNGRYSSEQDLAHYGAMLSEEMMRLTRLVDNVLSFSRISDSKNVYEMTDVDIGKAVSEALVRLQPQIHEKGLDVILHISDGLSNVRCDREAILQAFANVIENAIKFSDQRRQIEIRVFDSQGQVKVSVKDSGKGIVPEDIPYIFDKFFRGKNTRLRGTGLGLAITHKIIKDHGGDIFVDNVPDQGTLVTVAFSALETTE